MEETPQCCSRCWAGWGRRCTPCTPLCDADLPQTHGIGVTSKMQNSQEKFLSAGTNCWVRCKGSMNTVEQNVLHFWRTVLMCAWQRGPNNEIERTKGATQNYLGAWASIEIFPGGGKADILLIISGCWQCNANRCIHKRKCPMLRQQLHAVFSLRENFTLSKCLFWWARIF